MKYNIGTSIEEKYLDELVKAVQILELIDVIKYFGNSFNITDIDVSPNKIDFCFIIGNQYGDFEVYINENHDGKTLMVALCINDNNEMHYEIDRSIKNVLSFSLVKVKNNRKLWRKITYKKDSYVYNYDLLDYEKDSIWMQFETKKEISEPKLGNYLLSNDFSYRDLMDYLSNNYHDLKKCLIKVQNNHFNTLYQLKGDRFDEIELDTFIEDPVAVKVYKYN